MDKIFQLAIETILGLLIITCGTPPEESSRMMEFASTNAGTRFACIAQLNNNETFLIAGKIFKVNDTDVGQLPEFN